MEGEPGVWEEFERRDGTVMRRLHGLVLILCLSGLASSISSAQSLSHLWSARFGDSVGQHGLEACFDGEGNIFVTGYFWGSVDFGGGALTAVGNVDFFVAKFDAEGNHLWSWHDGNAVDLLGQCIATDADGNVLVAGQIMSSTAPVDLGGGSLAGPGTIFLAKYEADGHHLWSARHGGSDGSAFDVAVDRSNRILLTGYFGGTGDLGGETLTSVAFVDAFLAKYESDGTHIWSSLYGGAGGMAGHQGRSVAADGEGNVVLLGDFMEWIDLGAGPLVGAGLMDVFLAKFDPNGNHLFSRGFVDPEFQYSSAVSLDDNGQVLASGVFMGTVDFGGDPLTSAGGFDIFLAKYDANLDHIWSRRYGDAQEQIAEGVAMDGAGNVVCAGFFQGSVDFGGGPLTSAHGEDVFLARLDPDGNHLWSARFGSQNDQKASGVAVDAAGRTVIVGSFANTVDLGGGPLVSAGASDIFLAAFEPFDPAAIEPAAGVAIGGVIAAPNPMREGGRILFDLAVPGSATLGIYGPDGGLVRWLRRDGLRAGRQRWNWDGRDDEGRAVAPGAYFCQVRTDDGRSMGTRVVVAR